MNERVSRRASSPHLRELRVSARDLFPASRQTRYLGAACVFSPYRLRSSEPGSFSTKEVATPTHRMPWTHLQEQSHRDDAAAPKCRENKHITSVAPDSLRDHRDLRGDKLKTTTLLSVCRERFCKNKATATTLPPLSATITTR